jgi:tetratricopeptide (TPR) repeat protein
MKRIFVIITGLLLAAVTLQAQELADVINEFNAGVEDLNGQSYESALQHFNASLEMSDVVGDEAADMKKQTQEQIVGTHYRQAITLMRRKQYDIALGYLENTVNFSKEYGVQEEMAEKAAKYLPPLYLREGRALLAQEKYDEALETFDKVLSMDPTDYKAHQGKGLVYLKQEELDKMLEEFDYAREKAGEKNDQEVIDDINAAIDGYYRPLIEEELMMMDPDEGDYTYLLDICEQAISANEKNGYAWWQIAKAKNEMIEYEEAIAAAKSGIEFETNPTVRSALYYELGIAYQYTAQYAEACDALNNVTEEPFLARAERKMANVPDCN